MLACAGLAWAAQQRLRWPGAIALCGYVLAMSLLAALLMWLDKRAGRRGGPRVSEANLLWIGVLGGAPGALWALLTLRHKTRTWRFPLLLWSACLLWLAFLVWQVAGAGGPRQL